MLTVFLELHELETKRLNIEIQDESTIKEYYELRQQLTTYTKDMRDVINHPNYCLQFMQSGRLVRIKYMDYDFGWGAVVNFTQRRPSKEQKPEDITPHQSYVLDVLLQVADGASNGTKTHQDLPQGVRPPVEGEKAKMEVVPVLLSCIESIGHIRIFLPDNLKSTDQRNTVRKSLDEVKRRFPDGIAVLDPIENMGITDESFKKLMRVRILFSQCGSQTNSCHAENRSSRVPPSVKSFAQLSSTSRSLRPVRGEDGALCKDQSCQEADHCCALDHAAGRVEMSQACASSLRLHQRSRGCSA